MLFSKFTFFRKAILVLREKKVLRKEKPYSAGGRLKKKRLITRIGSRVPVPKRMGEFGSSVHRSGGSICSGGGETRCSAVWSAHLFWVQRAIGSNPVTLMWLIQMNAGERVKMKWLFRRIFFLPAFVSKMGKNHWNYSISFRKQKIGQDRGQQVSDQYLKQDYFKPALKWKMKVEAGWILFQFSRWVRDSGFWGKP